ncbi:hypothetical protein JYG23_04170 [Sedimentibacter sp. zth1]|uniref:hypothetical protein n=1 Tax=Sedimentibacter sp. zth1 TaxID=2816908 RepID=UPI001A92587B|nr:hypothetical protein [Sedimentibacter sp. zth1]QSX06657.1 hypothetical protein JYG23_04170 [Sedimentibacter sp. zth1]
MMITIVFSILVLLAIIVSKQNKHVTVDNDLHQVYRYSTNDNNDNYQAIETEYFRPSNLPILNNKDFRSNFFSQFYGKEPDNITLPSYLLEEPEDTIINYFSVLKQAANPVEGKGTGCGTLGYSRNPYPVAYNFLSSNYQEKLSYDEFLALFENMLHMNLIKVHEVPENESCDGTRYFIEFESIVGSEDFIGHFAYYYGFICMEEEGENYKIGNIHFQGEDYLCAPYHGWNYIGEAVVDITYGNWCSLVEERYETQQDGYVKNIYFKGTDGYEYWIQFFQLTNGKDIEIAQYRKNNNGEWELIKMNPKGCLD